VRSIIPAWNTELSSFAIIERFMTNISNDSVRFDLYLKNRQLKELEVVLKRIVDMPDKEQQEWIEENADIIHQGFDNFVDDSNNVLQRVSFDSETLELSEDLVVSLRDVLNLVQSLTSEPKQQLVS